MLVKGEHGIVKRFQLIIIGIETVLPHPRIGPLVAIARHNFLLRPLEQSRYRDTEPLGHRAHMRCPRAHAALVGANLVFEVKMEGGDEVWEHLLAHRTQNTVLIEGKARKGELVLAYLDGVHFPRAVGEVVCLVHEEDIFACKIKVTEKIGATVEKVVEVTDDDVAHLTVCQGKLIGAYHKFLRHGEDILAHHAGKLLFEERERRLAQAIALQEVASPFIHTAHHSLRANLLLRNQGNGTHHHPTLRERLDRITHHCGNRRLWGEIKNLLAIFISKRTNGGVKRTHRLTDACRRLREKGRADLHGMVDRVNKIVLSCTHAREGEASVLHRGNTHRRAMNRGARINRDVCRAFTEERRELL